MLNDSGIVETLTDLRNADGSFAINVNHVLTWGNKHITALDMALDGSYFYDPYEHVPNQAILNALNARIAQRYAQQHLPEARPNRRAAAQQLPAVLPQRAQVEVVRQQVVPPEQMDRPPEQVFNDNSQNVHLKEVEITTENSIRALMNCYSKSPISTSQTLKEIGEFIHLISHDRSFKKLYSRADIQYITDGYNYIKTSQVALSSHLPTGLTMLEVLALVWMGAKDKEQAPTDCSKVTDNIISLRKQAVLEAFKYVATTYRKEDGTFSPACIGGARNRIVNALNQAHPCVSIATTADGAQKLARESAYLWEKTHFLQLERSQQRAILGSWDLLSEDELSQKENTPAYYFHQSIKEDITKRLRQEYGTIVTKKYIRLLA